jgi:hypothetical protein
MRAAYAVASMLIIAACAPVSSHRGTLDARVVTIAPRPWPTAAVTAPDLRPRIIAVSLSETSVAPGDHWRGRIATSTNVASVEIRTESFSFVAERTAFGQFRFEQHVLDLVPQYKRAYLLQIIARNAAGEQTERVVPIRFL